MYAYFAGNNANKTFEPSNGGSGIRLNITNTMFSITILEVTAKTPTDNVPVVAKIRINRPNIIASKRFAITPARETQIIPFLIL